MSATTTPFLGCKISLISKSKIRYEGILYTIDPKESTIALAKVKSFGTEDRHAERSVPPRDEIFEYIIFRAGDIEDLIVDDPPSSMAPGLADPAIIQAHSTANAGSSNFPAGTFPSMVGGAAAAATIAASNANSVPGQRTHLPPFQTAFTAPTHVSGVPVHYNTRSNSVGSRSGNSTPTGGRSKSPRNDMGTRQSSGRGTPKDNRGPPRDNRTQNRRGSGQMQQYQQRRGTGGQQNYNRPQNYNYGANQHQSGARAQSQGSRGQNWGSSNRGQNRGPLVSRPPQQPRVSQTRIGQNRHPKEPLKFESEFDFEKSNKEFEELELSKKVTNMKLDDSISKKSDDVNDKNESAPVPAPATDGTNGESSQNNDAHGEENETFYDKTKSFFDSISCEAIERSRGNVQRVDWKQERKLNAETFGLSMNNWRRQGTGYGRGRGYNYGGGGGYNYNNRGGYYRTSRGSGSGGHSNRGQYRTQSRGRSMNTAGGGDTRPAWS